MLNPSAYTRGFWLVLIGPDGVGKTSVAQGIFPLVADRFESLRYHHWIPAWNRPLNHEIPASGGRFAPGPCPTGLIGNLLSLVRLGRNVCRAWLGYLLRVRPQIGHGRLVLGDRYLFNYVIDPESVRYGASARWVRLALSIIPKPDLVISLVADPEVIHKRKDELTIPEISERLSRARTLGEMGFNLVEVSANAPLESVVQQAVSAVLQNA